MWKWGCGGGCEDEGVWGGCEDEGVREDVRIRVWGEDVRIRVWGKMWGWGCGGGCEDEGGGGCKDEGVGEDVRMRVWERMEYEGVGEDVRMRVCGEDVRMRVWGRMWGWGCGGGCEDEGVGEDVRMRVCGRMWGWGRACTLTEEKLEAVKRGRMVHVCKCTCAWVCVCVCVCIGEGNKTSAWRGPVGNRWHIRNRLFVVRGVLIQFWQAINNTKYCTHEGADINWAPPKILWIPRVFSLCKMARFKRAIIMPHYTRTGTSIEVSCDGSVPLCSNHGWKPCNQMFGICIEMYYLWTASTLFRKCLRKRLNNYTRNWVLEQER